MRREEIIGILKYREYAEIVELLTAAGATKLICVLVVDYAIPGSVKKMTKKKKKNNFVLLKFVNN